MTPSLRRIYTTCFLTGAASISSSAQAQLGPEIFATTHFFGASRATSVRAYGMGGGIATTPGAFSLNPAHAAFIEETAGDARYGRTRFADGTRFNSTMIAAALPFGQNDGLQILGAIVRSPEKSSFAAAAPGFAASRQVFREESVSLFYGRRVSSRLALGIGVAPILRTRHEIRNVNFGAGPGTLRFSAKPPLDNLSHLGARLGLDYKFARWGRFSGFYDNFWEDANFIVPAQLAPLTTVRAAFHETALSGGLHLTPTRRLTIVLERERATVTGSNAFRLKGHNTYYGGEWQATRQLALRAGSHDGEPTFGLGWTKNRFSVQYAHVKNLAGDETRAIFGTNKFDVLEASYQF
jgi:hypothetical protein